MLVASRQETRRRLFRVIIHNPEYEDHGIGFRRRDSRNSDLQSKWRPLVAASRPPQYGFSSSLNDCLQQELTFRMQRFDSRQSNGR